MSTAAPFAATGATPYPFAVPDGCTLIPLEEIRPGPNDRLHFETEPLKALAENIALRGLDTPPTIRPLTVDGELLGYEVVCGERRTRACRLNGYTALPCRVLDVSDEEASLLMLRENTARRDLLPVDEAKGYQKRITLFGHTPELLAAEAGYTVQRVKSRLKLLRLIPEAQQLVNTGDLSLGYAQPLAEANLDTNRQRMALQALRENARPTAGWFRQYVSRLGAQQAQESLLDESFMVAPAAPAAPVLTAEDTTDPEPPTTIEPTAADRTDPVSALMALADLWETTAERYGHRGKPHKRAAAEEAAAALRHALGFLPTAMAAATATAPGARA